MKKIFFSFLVSLFLFSCQKEETPGIAPELPPVETMLIDFSNAEKSGVFTKTNWLFSAKTLGVWNAIIGTTFAVPVAAFKTAITHEPEYTGNLTWQWQYTVDGFTNQYTARLVGMLESTQVKWEMYVTKTGIQPFDEFLWFEGTSGNDGKSGQWIFNHSAGFPDNTIVIDWKKEGDNVGGIKYSYVRELNNMGEADVFNGSSLTYGLQEGDYDIYVKVHAYDVKNQLFFDTFIEWNRTGFNGHVKAEHFFNDTGWHCWDSQGNDVNCN